MKKIILLIVSLTLLASTAIGGGALMPMPKAFFLDNNGHPCVGCRLCSFVINSSTAKFTYSDEALTTQNSNPIILNSRGEAAVWLDGATKFKLLPATETDCTTGTAIWTVDNVSAQPYGLLTNSPWQASNATPTQTGASTFTTTGDQTVTFHVGRRIQATDGSSTLYGRISASSYSSGTNKTTVTVSLDSGSFTSSLSAISVSVLPVTNSAISADMITSGTTSANITSTGSNNFSGANTFSNITTATIGTANLTTVNKTGTGLVTNWNADLVDGYHASQTPGANQILVVNSSGYTEFPGFLTVPNTKGYAVKTTGGVNRYAISVDSNNRLILGETDLTGPYWLSSSDTIIRTGNSASTLTSAASGFAIGGSTALKASDKAIASGLATLGTDTLLAQNAPTGFTIGGNTAWHAGNDGPNFIAERGTSPQSITSGVITKVQYNDEFRDSNGNYDNATNYRFLPTVAGMYNISAGVFLGSSSANLTLAIIMIYLNGAISAVQSQVLPAGYNDAYLTTSRNFYMNGSTDYVEIYVKAIGTNLVVQNASQTFFTGSKLK